MMSASAPIVFVPAASSNGRLRKSTAVTSPIDELRAEALGLAPEHVHHLGTLDAVLEAGIVLDLGGDGELAAGLMALDQQRGEIGARRVERGGEAGGTGAENYEAVDFVCHLFVIDFVVIDLLSRALRNRARRSRARTSLFDSCSCRL